MRWFIMIALGFSCWMAASAEPPKEEPISARLIGRLAHSNQGKNDTDSIGEIVEIHFSPDGKRLMAGDYPGGAVNVWDISSSKRLAVMEMGTGYRGRIDYFAVSPDWKTVYSSTNGRGRKSNKIEVAGKTMISYSFDDAVQVFDVESGKLLGNWQHSPAREINWLSLAPDGALLITTDYPAGIYEDSVPSMLTLWNTQTGSHQDLGNHYGHTILFSPDNKQIALTKQSTTNVPCDQMVTFVDLSNMQSRTTIVLPENVCAWPCEFCAGGSVCAVRLDTYAPGVEVKNRINQLRFYDVGSGTELFRVPNLENEKSFYPVAVAPDGQTLAAAVICKAEGGTGPLLLVTIGGWRAQRIEFEEHTHVDSIAFHPNGKWLAVAVQIGQSNPPPSFVPQSQIRIIDAASGKTLETLVTPQCYKASLAFSPDGKTLASSGKGEVLLWDFSEEPRGK